MFLFIFLMVIVLGILSFKLGGVEALLMDVVSSTVGVFVFLVIANASGYQEGTLDGIDFLFLCLLLPGSIVNYKYVKVYNYQRMVTLKTSLIKDLEIKQNMAISEVENLKERLRTDKGIYKLLLLIQSCSTEKVDFYNNGRLGSEQKGLENIIEQIENRENEIAYLDKRLKEVINCDNYKLLANMKGSLAL